MGPKAGATSSLLPKPNICFSLVNSHNKKGNRKKGKAKAAAKAAASADQAKSSAKVRKELTHLIR